MPANNPTPDNPRTQAQGRDARVDPKAGDVLISRGVSRTALAVSNEFVKSLFASTRWKHTEWAPITTWRKWSKDAEVIHRAP